MARPGRHGGTINTRHVERALQLRRRARSIHATVRKALEHLKEVDFTAGIGDDGNISQLNREHFTARINLEATLRWNGLHLLSFLALLGSFMASLLLFEDIARISQIHRAMRQFYQIDNVDNLHNPDDIMNYIQGFIVQSYKMASALVDANTLDSIDVVRCFSDEIGDVCRLKFWSVPSYNRSAPNYLDLDALLEDTLSPFNVNSSIIDCSQPNPRSNCIDRSDEKFINRSLVRPTFGLLPEQPVVFDRRLNFPLASVVILTPVVWQTRSPRVPCGGFGSRYNEEVMRPRQGSNTAFTSLRINPRTGRTQTIFLTYEEDAFVCVDRSKAEDTTFFDRSWHPWATYEEMIEGQATKSVMFGGKPVYYKFVSDVSYMQAPTPGAVRLTQDPCTDRNLCDYMSKDDPNCVDPLQAGPDHPVWSVSQDLTYRTCSARSVWDSIYLNATQDAWSKVRQNTFFTIETTELNVASLVITPQMEGKPTYVTLVRVLFKIEQSGFMSGEAILHSTSDRSWTYFVGCGLVLLMAMIHLLITWGCFPSTSTLSPGCWTKVYDSFLCFGCSAHIISSIVMELTAAAVSDELMSAFHTNSQEDYFSTFSSIDNHQGKVLVSRTYGFILITFLFGRTCLYASLHPRLAVMVNTLAKSSDDLLHFIIYMGCAEAFLAFFAFWAFGQQMVEYSNFANVFWSQFRLFLGDFSMPTEFPDLLYVMYIVTYVFVIFILMLNFLLAIVVDAYSSVSESIKANKSERSIVADVIDIFFMWLYSKRRGWPSPEDVWKCLSAGGVYEHEVLHLMPAITAEELLANVVNKDGSPMFPSLEETRAYIAYYAFKVKEEGEFPLLETRREFLVPAGQLYDPCDGSFRDAISTVPFAALVDDAPGSSPDSSQRGGSDCDDNEMELMNQEVFPM